MENPCTLKDCMPDCEERTACTDTSSDHSWCGMCDGHNKPRHDCGCNNPDPAVGNPEPWVTDDAPTGPARPSDARLWPL